MFVLYQLDTLACACVRSQDKILRPDPFGVYERGTTRIEIFRPTYIEVVSLSVSSSINQ